MVKLGDRVRDVVTGYEGIASGISHFLNGCVSVGISAVAVASDGKIPSMEWLDEQRVAVVVEGAFTGMAQPSHATAGGPRESHPTESPTK